MDRMEFNLWKDGAWWSGMEWKELKNGRTWNGRNGMEWRLGRPDYRLRIIPDARRNGDRRTGSATDSGNQTTAATHIDFRNKHQHGCSIRERHGRHRVMHHIHQPQPTDQRLLSGDLVSSVLPNQ